MDLKNKNLLKYFDGIHFPSTKLDEIKKYDTLTIASTHNISEVKKACAADYITFSPVFNSKGRIGLGIEKLNEITKFHPNVLALGGIVSEKELKQFYNENKNNYKNDKDEILTYEEAKERIKKDYLAKLTKKEAVLAYKKLKEGAQNYKLITVTLNNNIIPVEKMKTLIQNGYLKPFVDKNEYISAKLVEEIKPKPLPFEKAKTLATKDLLNEKTLKALEQSAKVALNDIKGEKTGFITKYDTNKIKGLTPEEATEFLFTEFSLQKAKNYLLIPAINPQKAVIYKILEQKLLDKNKYEKNKRQIITMTQTTLNAAMLESLIKDLMAKYNIVTYVK